MRQALLLLGLVTVSTAAVVELRSDPPTRYSVCTVDRGYTTGDANLAALYLVNNVTRSNGRYMERNSCIYGHHNTTVVSICNGSGRNRTVTQSDVTRAVSQLQKDCGTDGSYSGYHVVNNLTLQTYGIMGGKNLRLPPGWSTPVNKKTKRDDPVDCSANPGFDGSVRTNCKQPDDHYIVDGFCGKSRSPKGCSSYCELSRSYFIGPEMSAPDTLPQTIQGGKSLTMTKGTSITIGGGISVGADGEFWEVITAGVSFELTKEVTTTVEQEYTSDVIPFGKQGRLVIFGQMIESCGTVTTQNYQEPSTIGDGGPGIGLPGFCDGDPVNTENVCTLTPWLTNGVATPFYATRFEEPNGSPLPIDQQPDSYRNICLNYKTEDGSWPCQAPQ